MPVPEVLIWQKLRDRQINGLKFRRQYSVGNFILDFYCPELRLAVEIDGESHYLAGSRSADRSRDNFIKSNNIEILRFTNKEITDNLNGVLEIIMRHISNHTAPNPA